MLGDASQDIGEPSLRINIVHFGVTIRLYINAARSPPRSEPQNNQDFLPRVSIGVCMSRIDTDDGKFDPTKLMPKPARHRAGFKADALSQRRMFTK
jgi:hypothetical protein